MNKPNSDNLSRFAALIGLDWADGKHAICLQEAATAAREFGEIVHRPEAIDVWAQGLRRRFGGKPVAIALELTKGPIVYALRKYEFFVLFPVDPTMLAKYREALSPSGAKDDPTDAELALEFLLKHPEKLAPLNPQSARMRTLEQLVEMRRRLVNDQTRITNRLTSTLKNYYPQALEWFPDKASLLFCDFLTRWPTPKAARAARRATLKRFFHEHNARRPRRIEERIDAIKRAVPLTDDAGVIEPCVLLVTAMVGQLRVTIEAIERFDEKIAECAPAHPDFAIFDSFPATGPVCGPRLLVAFGEQRERYPAPDDVQRYVGIAPVTKRSGNSTWIHWRYKCPKFLRQTFVEWAGLTIPRSLWAAAYYQQQRSKGSSHHAAVRALAYKWIRILHHCWRTGQKYDETTYLRALKKRGSPLLEHIVADATPNA
jgi:transposase